MLFKYASSFALAMLLSLNMHAEHEHHNDRQEEKREHHHGKEIEININDGHCHQKERSLGGKIAAGTIQLVENNAYLLSFLAGVGYGYIAASNPRFRDKQIPVTACQAAAIWIGGGLATRNILRAAMSQCNIPRL